MTLNGLLLKLLHDLKTDVFERRQLLLGLLGDLVNLVIGLLHRFIGDAVLELAHEVNLRSFILRKCCETHEWQQCESCAAAWKRSANGRTGP
ncbi:hypothetical protein SAMN05444340_115110 [Citreimonas salinaria]|uniref:Uncharacterized protein n=1 Tax=Citreimonas salinaria TaxID=321339 RepID=A0A1H3M5M7_9RHOB|nr:hypothetical protein SAMN05444340_115110 [Citreimonas salinaria]